MRGYTRNIYLSCIFRAIVCQLQATGKLTCKRSANRAALQRSYPILKVHFATIYHISYIHIYIYHTQIWNSQKDMLKAIATGISHTNPPLKMLVPFPVFLDVLFQTFPVVHLPEKERNFLQLTNESIPWWKRLGGHMGWAAWSYSQPGGENSVVAALFFRDFGEHAKDHSIERNENRGKESNNLCFLSSKHTRKHWKIYDSNTISSWFIFRWFMLP